MEKLEFEKTKAESLALKAQVEKLQNAMRGQQAQIQAQKELLDESMQTACVVRTNFVLLKQQHNAVAQELNNTRLNLDKAKAEVEALKKEIEELKKPAEVPPSVEPVAPVEEPAAA